MNCCSNNKLNDTFTGCGYNKLTPFKYYCLTSFPYIEEDFDALTNYELLCKIVCYLNKSIDTVNDIGLKTEELCKAFNALKEFVDNFLKNLDIQDEINKKLDEMAADGTLADIINEYLDQSLAFLHVADIKPAYQVWSNEVESGLSAQSVSIGIVNDIKYLVACLTLNDDPDSSVLNLYDLGTNEKLFETVSDELGHSNDITFDPVNNLFVITIDDTHYALFDPLTHLISKYEYGIEDVTKITGIAYKEENKYYISGVLNAKRILGEIDLSSKTLINYHEISTNDTILTGAYHQGIEYDGNFIYYCYGKLSYGYQPYNESHGQIDVYSKNYKYVNTVLTPYLSEFESLCFFNDKYYLMFQGAASGIICIGNLTKSANVSDTGLSGVDYGILNRDNMFLSLYVGDRNHATFIIDNSAAHPFLNLYTALRSAYRVSENARCIIYINNECEIPSLPIYGSNSFRNIYLSIGSNVHIDEITVSNCSNVYINSSSINNGNTVNKINITICDQVQIRNINFTPAADNDYAIECTRCDLIEINAYSNTGYNLLNSAAGTEHLRLTNANSTSDIIPQIVTNIAQGGLIAAAALGKTLFKNCGKFICNTELTNADVTKVYCTGDFLVAASNPTIPINEAGIVEARYHANSILLTYYARQHQGGVNSIYNRRILLSDNIGTVAFDSGWQLAIQSYYPGEITTLRSYIPIPAFIHNNKLYVNYQLNLPVDRKLNYNITPYSCDIYNISGTKIFTGPLLNFIASTDGTAISGSGGLNEVYSLSNNYDEGMYFIIPNADITIIF